MSKYEDAMKDLEGRASRQAILSEEDRRAITESLLDESVVQSLNEAGLECQLRRRNLRKGMFNSYPNRTSSS